MPFLSIAITIRMNGCCLGAFIRHMLGWYFGGGWSVGLSESQFNYFMSRVR